jgi:hypothetical protein
VIRKLAKNIVNVGGSILTRSTLFLLATLKHWTVLTPQLGIAEGQVTADGPPCKRKGYSVKTLCIASFDQQDIAWTEVLAGRIDRSGYIHTSIDTLFQR